MLSLQVLKGLIASLGLQRERRHNHVCTIMSACLGISTAGLQHLVNRIHSASPTMSPIPVHAIGVVEKRLQKFRRRCPNMPEH